MVGFGLLLDTATSLGSGLDTVQSSPVSVYSSNLYVWQHGYSMGTGELAC